jgi:hypothetical protein
MKPVREFEIRELERRQILRFATSASDEIHSEQQSYQAKIGGKYVNDAKPSLDEKGNREDPNSKSSRYEKLHKPFRLVGFLALP